MHPSFVVSVAVLIINIHKYKSRAVNLYLIKHRILTREGFIDIKSLRVMYYTRSRLLRLLIIFDSQWAYELLISF